MNLSCVPAVLNFPDQRFDGFHTYQCKKQTGRRTSSQRYAWLGEPCHRRFSITLIEPQGDMYD